MFSLKCGVTFNFQITYVRAKAASTTINNRKYEKGPKYFNKY